MTKIRDLATEWCKTNNLDVDSYDAWVNTEGYQQGYHQGRANGLRDGYLLAIQQNSNLLVVGEWIDAKVNMPPENTLCLVDSDEGVMSAYYYGEDTWSEGGIAWINYWMPLLKAPKRS